MNKIIIAVIVIVAVMLGIWAYPTLKNRYFSSENPPSESSIVKPEKEAPEAIFEPTAPSDETGAEAEDIPSTSAFEISPQDCDNECSGIDNSAKTEYCKNVCGLSGTTEKPEKTEDCTALQGLPRDYCFKDTAVARSDFSFCEKIDDKSIRSACINRVSEDIIDKKL